MPIYTRGKKRDNMVFVHANPVILWGYKTKDLAALSGISATDLATQLGHIKSETAQGLVGAILVVGANAPKPPRVTKKLTAGTTSSQRSVSTYCSTTTLSIALQNGWTMSKGNRGVILRAASLNRPSQTAVAKLSDGTLYAFPMNSADFKAYGTRLGLQDATTLKSDQERNSLVSGCRLPRPGKASLELSDGSTFSSFFSSNHDIGANGFSQMTSEIVLKPLVGNAGA
jgi:hypothetical protein